MAAPRIAAPTEAPPNLADQLRARAGEYDQATQMIRRGRVSPGSRQAAAINQELDRTRGIPVLMSFEDQDVGSAHADFLRARGDLDQAAREAGIRR